MIKTKNQRKYRNIKRVNFIVVSILLILLFFRSTQIVKAASSTVYFETEKQSVIIGDEITVYLCVSTDVTLGNFEGYITYDAKVLEYKSGSSCITGGDGLLEAYDYGGSTKNTRKYNMNFKVIGTGVFDFKLKDSSVAYEHESGNAMSISSLGLTVVATEPTIISNNSSLSTININPGTLSPSFDPEVLVYNTEVDANTDKFTLSAIAKDVGAEVKIRGNEKLVSGDNKIVIEVVAEDKSTKEYVIHVKKDELLAEQQGGKLDENKSEEQKYQSEELKNQNDRDGWYFEVLNNSGEISLFGQYYYMVTEASDNVIIPKGYIKSDFELDNYRISAYQKEGNTESDFVLLILSNNEGSTGLYRYDRVEKTIQRYVHEQDIVVDSYSASLEMENLYQKVQVYKKNANQLIIIIAVLCGFSGLLIIGLIRLYIKSKGMQDDLD